MVRSCIILFSGLGFVGLEFKFVGFMFRILGFSVSRFGVAGWRSEYLAILATGF